MTAASRKSMRPAVRKSEAQGTTTSRAPKAKALTLDEVVTATLAAHGSPDSAFTNVEAAALALAKANESIAAWVKVAAEWAKAGRSARAFAAAVDGNANTLGRLVSAGSLITASKAGKGTRTLTPREAVKIANTSNRTKVASLVADMGKGLDPLQTKATRPGAVKPASTKAKAGPVKSTTVTPDTYVAALTQVLNGLGSVTKASTLVDIARLAETIAAEATALAATKASGRKSSPDAKVA